VVAGEVRTLAQRSASAAKEIRTLIGESVERVSTGSKLAAWPVRRCRTSSRRSARDRHHDRDRGSVDEQRDGIEQVNRAVSQMDEVSQQNAALVEQARPPRRRSKSRRKACVGRWGRSGRVTHGRRRMQRPARLPACRWRRRGSRVKRPAQLRSRARRRDEQQLHRRAGRADEQLAGPRAHRACRSRPR
jgi:hypothetical protein